MRLYAAAFAEVLEVDIERALDLAVTNSNRVKIAESDAAIAGEARRQTHRTRGVTVRGAHNSSYVDYQNEQYGFIEELFKRDG